MEVIIYPKEAQVKVPMTPAACFGAAGVFALLGVLIWAANQP